MPGTVKRAISLPKAQDDRLKKLARECRMAYSAVVQTAIQLLIDSQEDRELVNSYRSYLADKGNRERVCEAVKDFESLARKSW